MKRLRVGHLLLVVPLVLVAAWLAARGRASREDPAEVLRALRAAQGPSLPDARAAGASARSETSSYDRDTLYEYIDGAAEAYLARGFERCIVATYTFAVEAAGIDVSAEVYRFAASAGAREQMVAERPTDAAPLGTVPDAFGDATTLVAVRGRDYLKLTAVSEGKTSGPLAAIAAAWAGGRP